MLSAFNPILDTPPVTALVNGHTYRVQSDFRTALAYIRLLSSDETDEDKDLLGLSMFFPGDIHQGDVSGLLGYISWFIRRGKEPEEGKEKKTRLFDVLVDSGRIYSAFFQAYRINLNKAQLHWWLFGELLEGLPKGTHLADVIEIRGRKEEKWMSAADRLELARAKDYYRIEDNPKDVMGDLFSFLAGLS